MEKKNTLAMVGFVSSVVSFFCCCNVLSIPAMICSIIAYNNAKDYSKQKSYADFAMAGIIISGVGVVSACVTLIINFFSGFILAIAEMCRF